MLKYLAIFALILGLAVYIARQDEHAAQYATQKTAYQNNAAVSAESNKNHPQESVSDAEWNAPGWYSFFRWPNSTTAWAIILTLFAIAEQTKHTAEAADATRQSVGAIQAQSGHLETQAGQMSRQADLMKEQLDTARQKERPKLRIQFEIVDLQFTESPDVVPINCRIQNHGGSVAFIVGSLCGCWIGETTVPEERRHTAFAMNLPNVLGPGDKPVEPTIVLAHEDSVVDLTMWNTDDPQIEGVRNGSKSIYASGFVMYTNIFDETWMLSFKQKFTVHNLGHGMWSGEWYRDGDDENYERQKLPKPN